MRPSIIVALGCLFVMSTIAGCGGGGTSGDGNGDPGMRMGLLQFRTVHNLANDDCLADNDCGLVMEDETDTAAWLNELAGLSNMAVLHWDRSIPWLAFDTDPPPGTSRVDFYDGRIDAPLRSWINAYVPYFQRMPSGYLAISVLNGNRTGLQPYRVDGSPDVDVTDACPVMEPGTTISFQYEQNDASFDLARSYTNFVLYLYDKLQPDYLALMVEVNLYKELSDQCAANWDGLARLYHHVYDVVRDHVDQVDSRVKVFATLSLQPLLAYNNETCHGELEFEPCTGTPSPPGYDVPDPDDCYPLDLSAVNDLDLGDRLEILALSFYPDALLMDVADNNLIKLFPETWDGVGECDLRAQATPYLDPVPALDRFNWTKPMAIAELGARSGRTLQFKDIYLMQPPGDLTSQNFWLDHFLTAAKDRDFEFYVQAFSDDFVAIGPWTVHLNVLDRDLYSLFNNFAYMGIYDHQGMPKAGITQTWLDALP